MSASVHCHPAANPEEVWPGRVHVDPTGAKLATEMLLEIHNREAVADGIAPWDYCSLEDWPRQGRPFRNIVLEYLRRARAKDAEAAFCAVLSDFIAITADGGTLTDVDGYIRAYAGEVPK